MDQTVWDETTVKYESGNPGCSGLKDDQNLYGYCDSHLNFSAANNSEDDEYSYGKKKLSRDPLSHRIIEKRRRDRMNNCLADLSRLIPQDYMKKGRGRVEKTEIIEMAIRHMKHLMSHSSPDNSCCKREDSSPPPPMDADSLSKSYRLGYHDCLSEALHFLVDTEGYLASGSLCTQLATHLTHHCDSLINGEGLRVELCRLKEEASPNGYGSSRSSGGGCGPGSHESGSESSCLTHLSTANNVSQYTNLRIDQWRDHPFYKVSPTSSGSDKCSSVESKCSLESGYKFKHTIQRRFESSIPASGGGSASSSLVPAFALSPRGHYYLPICLDPTILPRDEMISCPEPPEVVLHPVTISVNFRPPQPTSTNASSLPVKQGDWSSY